MPREVHSHLRRREDNMSLEENVLKYGVSGGIRYREPEKLYFLNVISKDFQELGYNVQILKKENKRFSGINAYIGDLAKAKHLVIAPYDTTVNSLNTDMKFYPFDNMGTQKGLYEKIRFKALRFFLGVVLLLFLVLNFISVSPKLFQIIAISTLAIATFITYIMLKGRPNPVSANLNTSGVLALLELAKEQPKHTAFILVDREFVDHLGHVMINEALPTTLDDKSIIHLNGIGNGEHIVIASKEEHVKMARNVAANHKVKLFALDDYGLSEHALKYYDKAISISVCDEFNGRYEISNVMNDQDVKIDEAQFNKVVSIVSQYLKTH